MALKEEQNPGAANHSTDQNKAEASWKLRHLTYKKVQAKKPGSSGPLIPPRCYEGPHFSSHEPPLQTHYEGNIAFRGEQL
jgi:hypothetical protein